MDFITCLPTSSAGYDAVLVFCDKLSKLVRFAPCHTTCTATQAADLFFQHVFRSHGVPLQMIHDRGTQFHSTFWKEFFNLCGVKQTSSTAYHPQTDGQTERVNRVLEDYLRHYVDDTQSNWDKYLVFAEFAYNNVVHESTGSTPFRLTYGYDPLSPVTLLSEPHRLHQQQVLKDLQKKTHCPDAAVVFMEYMQQTLAMAKARIKEAQLRQKQGADRRRREVSFAKDDKVLLSTANLRLKTGSRKLLPRFIGPFTVKEVINPVAYKLDLPHALKVHDVFHVSLLRPYHEAPDYRFRAPPLPEIIEGELEYEVEAILGHRMVNKKARSKRQAQSGVKNPSRRYEFLIRWKGYSPDSDSWEPESHLKNCPKTLFDYKKDNKMLRVS